MAPQLRSSHQQPRDPSPTGSSSHVHLSRLNTPLKARGHLGEAHPHGLV